MPIGWGKPVNAARYQDLEVRRTRFFTIAVEIRDRFNPGSDPYAKLCGGLGITTECGTWKWKRLRHWLCSSHLLLRGSLEHGFMHRRSLDAIAAFASQTPAPPRRVSRFFRVWLPYKSPCRADHSAYFGLASFISPILSAVDVDQTKQSRERCQCKSRVKTKYL